MYKKLISTLLAIVMILSCAAVNATEDTMEKVQVQLTDYEIVPYLNTNQVSFTYEGERKETVYSNNPTEGKQYLIVTVDVTVPSEVASFPLEVLKVETGEEVISPMPEAQFLEKHFYKPFTAKEITAGNHSGNLIYEIPLDITIEEVFLNTPMGKLALADVKKEENGDFIKDTNISLINLDFDVSKEQNKVDEKLKFASEDSSYTLENPYIMQDPYGRSPLSAVAVFQTEDEATISVSIESKSEYGQVTYEVPNSGTKHSVPIVGLYANHLNNVTVSANYADGSSDAVSFKLQTGELPESIVAATSDVLEVAVEDEHFTMVAASNNLSRIVDMTGEIRWLYNDIICNSVVYMENGHMLVAKRIKPEMEMYYENQTAILYDIDMLGKIYRTYELNEFMHHEIMYLGDNKIMYTSASDAGVGMEDAYTMVDLSNGKVIEQINLNEIFTRYRLSPGYGYNADWFHTNSLDYNTETNDMVICGRQFGVAKLNEERKIDWILAPHEGFDEESKQYLLTPVDENGNPLYAMDTEEGKLQADAEFFPWHQHGIRYAPDLDNNPSTVEVQLFNNRDHRNEAYPYVTDDVYSEGVIYSIDETNMTVRCLYRYGSELGEHFMSNTGSATEILPNGHVMINAADHRLNSEYRSWIIETDGKDEVLWSLKMKDAIWTAETIEEFYPKNFTVNTDSSIQKYTIDVRNPIGDIPYIQQWPIVELEKGDFEYTPLASGRLYVKGILKQFKFDRQYAYLTLTTPEGKKDTYGLLNNRMKIDQAVSIESTAYIQAQITVVDERAKKIYQYPETTVNLYNSKDNLNTWEDISEKLEVGYFLDTAELNMKEENLKLSGWAFMQNVNSSESTQISIVLDGEKGKYSKSFPISLRPDVTESLGNKEYNYDNSGIHIIIPLNTLPNDTYKIGIEIINGEKISYKLSELFFTIERAPSTLVPYENINDTQAEITKALQTEYESGEYPLENPFVKVDPYGVSPLSAIVMFETETPTTVSIEVQGINGGKTLSHQYTKLSNSHAIPIYGLYSEQETTVTIVAKDENGKETTKTLAIAGKELPDNLYLPQIVKSNKAEMYGELMFHAPLGQEAPTHFYASDANGDVRFVIPSTFAFPRFLTVLDNGHLLITSSKNSAIDTASQTMYEIDYTGRIYKEYKVVGMHHDLIVLPNGNFVVPTHDMDYEVVENVAFEVDRKTGEVVKTWHMDSYFAVPRYNDKNERISDQNYRDRADDWFHMNSVSYNEETDQLIFSARHQDAVVCINYTTGELEWIISNPDSDWTPLQKDKLLTPIGENFTWQYGQHNIQFISKNEVMMLDNAVYGGKTKETNLPEDENSSRGVIYRIDDEAMTIEQVWEYHPEGQMAGFISGIQKLGEDHYLVNFGGKVKDEKGNPTYNIGVGFGVGSISASIHEIKNGELVYEANIGDGETENGMYRVEYKNMYENSQELDMTTRAVELGGLFDHDFETQSRMPSDRTLKVENLELLDDGTQLRVVCKLPEMQEGEKVYLYLEGKEVGYRVEIGEGSDIKLGFDSTYLPIDSYELYIGNESKAAKLGYVWENTAKAVEKPQGYIITVSVNDESKGIAEGSGKYYENTALTVEAKANEGSKFVGWKIGEEIVSTDTKYSFTPVADTDLIAVFE